MASRFAPIMCVLCLACGGSATPTAPTSAPTSNSTPDPVTDTYGGSLSADDATCSSRFSSHDNKPCRRYTFATTRSGEIDATVSWTGGTDLDLELWRDSTILIASLPIAAGTDRVRTSGQPGSYEMRVVYNSGTAPTDYMLRITHAQ